MDKIYFASSDGSIRSSDDELYHLFGWKKKDAKYIKRERKNGKWVYTYPEEDKKAEKAATKQKTTNTRGSSGVGTGPRTVSKEYEAEVAYNSQKNSSSSSKNSTGSSTSKVTAGKNAVTISGNTSKEYQEEVAYNSQKNVYPNENGTTSKANSGRTTWGNAGSGAADAETRKKAEDKAYVANVRDNAKKAAENKKVLTSRANSGSDTTTNVDPKKEAQAKNVADFWKSFNNSKTFYSRGNDGTPDTETKTKVAEQSINKKANAEDYKNYLEYRAKGAKSARDYEEWKNDPENNYWQEIEQEYQKDSTKKEERGLVGTLVDAAKDWWGDDEREYYEKLLSKKNHRDRRYEDASDRAWEALDKLSELEEAAKTGTKRVTQKELEDAYATFWNAANYLDYQRDHYDAFYEAFDKAETEYRKTKAFQHDQRVESIEDFFEDVGDSIENGRDWLEDLLGIH